jgi:hypothetical protein
MTFIDKLKFLKDELEKDTELADVIELSEGGADEEFLGSLKSSYPFLPKSIFDLLRMTDGMDVFGITFFGSNKHTFSDLSWLKDLASSFLDTNSNFPFAKDADGSILWISSNGEVKWDPEPETGEHVVIEDSFDDFMDKVMFGPFYFTKLNPDGIDDDEEEWGRYLERFGWAKVM